MSKRTDKDLIKIITIERDSYEPLAVEAVMAEIEKRNLDISVIEETKKYVIEEFEKQEILNDTQIGSSARIIHLVVDTMAFHFLAFILFIPALYIVPSRADDLAYLEVLGISLFFLSFFAYYIVMELAFQKTIGKYITKTKIILQNGEKPDFMSILKRTVCRLLPFDSISFISNKKGFHDTFSNTMVVRDN